MGRDSHLQSLQCVLGAPNTKHPAGLRAWGTRFPVTKESGERGGREGAKGHTHTPVVSPSVFPERRSNAITHSVHCKNRA